MLHILVKEINSFLNSLIAYVVISVFLTAIGLLMWIFPETNVLSYGYAEMSTLFTFGPYVFMFLIPAITMRMFAEEKKAGTLELLFTQPLTDWNIILGKFFSGWLLVVFAIVPTFIYYITVYQLSSPVGNVDTPGIAGSYIGLILLGGLFTAIGIFTSSITSNQIIAFVLAVFGCFIFYSGFESLSGLSTWGDNANLIEQFGITYHYNAMSKGLLDSRNLIYFASSIGLMLLFTKTKLGSRKW